MTDPYSVLTIGALSQATGVPVETLRTWERRYGFPAPIERSDSGHRRYPLDAVERLRLVVRALGEGHKPSVVLRAGVPTLRELIAVSDGAAVVRVPRSTTKATFVERCLDYVLGLDDEGLVNELERAWNADGALKFLSERLGPLLGALGEEWNGGKLEIGHEHFTSEHVREFLSARWRPLSDHAGGPRIVCATPAGELHALGIHMAATALALADAQIVFLGASTPADDVASAAKRQGARAIALSAARGTARAPLAREVAALRRAVGSAIPIVVGGAGFDPPPPGVLFKADFAELNRWARGLARERG